MKRLLLTVPIALLALWGFAGPTLADSDSGSALRTRLTGFQEVPPILTNGHGTLTLRIRGDHIDYELTYSDLSSPATAAHIHFAQKGVNGGIVAFLCGGGGKPVCPPGGGRVTGTITPADILAIPAQGLAAGNFAGAVRIIRSGDSYGNVHTTNHPDGEIRGQIPGTDRED